GLGQSANGLRDALAQTSKQSTERSEADKALETAQAVAKIATDKIQGLKIAVEQASTKKAEAEKALAEKQPEFDTLKARADELAARVEDLDNEAKALQAKSEAEVASGSNE